MAAGEILEREGLRSRVRWIEGAGMKEESRRERVRGERVGMSESVEERDGGGGGELMELYSL